jgi:tRNA A-37 threonylcarbamoyl transferase component Bud32
MQVHLGDFPCHDREPERLSEQIALRSAKHLLGRPVGELHDAGAVHDDGPISAPLNDAMESIFSGRDLACEIDHLLTEIDDDFGLVDQLVFVTGHCL